MVLEEVAPMGAHGAERPQDVATKNMVEICLKKLGCLLLEGVRRFVLILKGQQLCGTLSSLDQELLAREAERRTLPSRVIRRI